MRGHASISPHFRWAGCRTGLSALLVTVALGAVFTVMSPAGDGQAEMRVKLKDGRVLTLPVDPDDIDSVTFPGKPGDAADVLKRQPIRRAADQIRDDEQSIRRSRDAENRAAEAAKAAEAAATAAAEAAAV